MAYKNSSGAPEDVKGTNGSAHFTDAVNISGYSQSAPVSLSTSAAQSAALTGGLYDVNSDVTCYLKVAATANDVVAGAASGSGYKLVAGNTITLVVPDGQKIGGITSSGSGTLEIHRVG